MIVEAHKTTEEERGFVCNQKEEEKRCFEKKIKNKSQKVQGAQLLEMKA